MSKITNDRLNPVWHRMLYSCTHMATMGAKVLRKHRKARTKNYLLNDSDRRRRTKDSFHATNTRGPRLNSVGTSRVQQKTQPMSKYTAAAWYRGAVLCGLWMESTTDLPQSAPFFIPSTSFCSLSSWFTSSCAYHPIKVTAFALAIYHSLRLSLQT